MSPYSFPFPHITFGGTGLFGYLTASDSSRSASGCCDSHAAPTTLAGAHTKEGVWIGEEPRPDRRRGDQGSPPLNKRTLAAQLLSNQTVSQGILELIKDSCIRRMWLKQVKQELCSR